MPVLQSSPGADVGIALSNPTLSDVNVIFTARDYSGNLMGGGGVVNPTFRTIPALGQIALRASEIFGPGVSGQSGWVMVEADSSSVKGFFMVFDSALSYI